MSKLITFKTAVLAKEKGFNLKVRSMYCEEKLYADTNSKGNYNDIKWVRTWRNSPDDDTLSAPTQSELQTWLRDVYGILAYVTPYMNKNPDGEYKVTLFRLRDHFRMDSYDGFKTWEEALEEGLFEALKLLP